MRDGVLPSAMRAAVEPLAYGFQRSFDALPAEWRTFGRHYLLYASRGSFTLAVEQAQWLLPPERAAWIAADVPIRVGAAAPVTSCSVLFARSALAPPALPCQVFSVTPLAREMFLHAMRWGQDRDPADAVADRFFTALADVCAELAATPDNLWLPRGQSRETRLAIAYTMAHLAEPLRLADAAGAVGVAGRTLARRFALEIGMPWRQVLHRARMIAAVEHLVADQLSVTEVVFAVGFESLSAFSQAFRRFAGLAPTDFRRQYQRR